jgi:Secretion system C-terminal sorting domain
MKKFIYTIATFLTVVVCSAQSTILQAEYFWDTDPGLGLATPVLATDGNFNSAFEQLTKTGIALPSLGLHVLNIRIKDNVNGWGPVFRNVISVQTTLETPGFDLKNVIVYPNPVKDILNLSFETIISSASVYTVLGQEVLTQAINANEGTIDLSSLTSGTYFVKVYANSLVKTLKVIKE